MPADAPTILATSGGLRRRPPDAAGRSGRSPSTRSSSPASPAARRGSASSPRPWATARSCSRRSTTRRGSRGSRRRTWRCSRCPTWPTSASHLLEQDVVWVWRRQRGRAAGHVAAARSRRRACARPGRPASSSTGVSAGSICWHVGGTDRLLRPGPAPGDRRAGLAALRQRRALRLGGAAPAAAAAPGRRRHAADRLRDRRRRRPALPRHRAGRGARPRSRTRPHTESSGDRTGTAVETRIEPRLLS